jgi:hypothetical protein
MAVGVISPRASARPTNGLSFDAALVGETQYFADVIFETCARIRMLSSFAWQQSQSRSPTSTKRLVGPKIIRRPCPFARFPTRRRRDFDVLQLAAVEPPA